jgi:hypothetical protein
MEQSLPREANRISASQEISNMLRERSLLCVHKDSPPVPVLSQMNPVHTIPLFLYDPF